MSRKEPGRCPVTASGRHFWIELKEQGKEGVTRYRCRSCGQETAELVRPIDAKEDHPP